MIAAVAVCRCARTAACYGYRGTRVGEASNPGPGLGADSAIAVDAVGRLVCPWCQVSAANERGLMQHVSLMHAGAASSDSACQMFVALSRGGMSRLRSPPNDAGREREAVPALQLGPAATSADEL